MERSIIAGFCFGVFLIGILVAECMGRVFVRRRNVLFDIHGGRTSFPIGTRRLHVFHFLVERKFIKGYKTKYDFLMCRLSLRTNSLK